MNHRNYIVTILLLFFVTINLQAQTFEEITVPLSDPNQRGLLVVDIRSGPITVQGTARQDILVKYASLEESETIEPKQGKNGLRKINAASIDLEISESDNRIKVNSDSWNRGLILKIEVPKQIDLKLESYNNGNVEVDNVEGALELTSYNGPIAATNISGSLLADTYNGKILATFDKVTPDEPMAFTNYNGGIDLTFPTDLQATFKISNKRGDVYTGFDMTMEKPKIEKKEGKKTFKVQLGKWVIGKVNGGGAEISLENHNGDVYIRKTGSE
ncbi:MAG: DUF4097 family beta strand repeat-containing protein [Bacteroidota bacterium]